jgi:hypothetical protein
MMLARMARKVESARPCFPVAAVGACPGVPGPAVLALERLTLADPSARHTVILSPFPRCHPERSEGSRPELENHPPCPLDAHQPRFTPPSPPTPDTWHLPPVSLPSPLTRCSSPLCHPERQRRISPWAPRQQQKHQPNFSHPECDHGDPLDALDCLFCGNTPGRMPVLRTTPLSPRHYASRAI